jgi:hypothetical protein
MKHISHCVVHLFLICLIMILFYRSNVQMDLIDRIINIQQQELRVMKMLVDGNNSREQVTILTKPIVPLVLTRPYLTNYLSAPPNLTNYIYEFDPNFTNR